jgi:death-on-curing protein
MNLLPNHLQEALKGDLLKIKEKDKNTGFIVTVEDVIKAHYFVCDYFESETGERSLYGIRDYNLLVSAISRQNVCFEGKEKYKSPIEKCATFFYGLVKNHAFHDGNKRTALLSTLYFLTKIGRHPTRNQKEFEELTVRVAANKLNAYSQWGKFKGDEDAEIKFIIWKLSKLSEKNDYKIHSMTYRELNTQLHVYDFYLEQAGTQEINLCWDKPVLFGKKKKEVLYQIGFKGWKKQVGTKSLICILKIIAEKKQIDYSTFYKGGEPLYELIDNYAGPLSRLKDK